jgi:hypothetical protein
MLPECREGQDSSMMINMTATSKDGIVGTRKAGSQRDRFVQHDYGSRGVACVYQITLPAGTGSSGRTRADLSGGCRR